MEVARLQLQISECLLRQPSNPNIQEALSRLNSELLDITTLYGEFAHAFGLAECELAIVHCAGHYDQSLIESLWSNIINQEINSNAGKGAEQELLRAKLVSLGRQYVSSERYFPLAFLVRFLEIKSCTLGFASDLVFSTLQDVGVPVAKLLSVYDQLFKAHDPCWQSLKKPFHLLISICCMLNRIADKPLALPVYERRAVITACVDAVTSYLVELQASSDPAVLALVSDLKNLQARLDRAL